MIRSIFQPKEFTGKHMLFSMLAFFGVIITVNLVMARFAVTTWSGLVVPNSYVASQEFNGKAAQSRAIDALGYQVKLTPNAEGLEIDFIDSDGNPALADSMTTELRRPVAEHQDREIVLVRESDGIYRGKGDVPEGEWIATVTATRDGQTIYKRGWRFHVTADGSMTE